MAHPFIYSITTGGEEVLGYTCVDKGGKYSVRVRLKNGETVVLSGKQAESFIRQVRSVGGFTGSGRRHHPPAGDDREKSRD